MLLVYITTAITTYTIYMYIQYTVNANCTVGQVRLADGSTTYEGRVEVCRSGVWVAIYDSGWSYYDALVVCRQLGYPYQCKEMNANYLCMLHVYICICMRITFRFKII